MWRGNLKWERLKQIKSYYNNIYKGKIDKTQQKSNVVFLEK